MTTFEFVKTSYSSPSSPFIVSRKKTSPVTINLILVALLNLSIVCVKLMSRELFEVNNAMVFPMIISGC
jgi:hypothetical protein